MTSVPAGRSAGDLREDIGGWLQLQLDGLAPLDLLRRRRFGAVVGDRGRLDDDGRLGEAAQDGGAHLFRAGHLNELDAGGGVSGVMPEISMTRAPRATAASASA